ncbi:MAG TPA: ribose-phosphate pyrophosphokinase [Nitrososphaerales archaeon]|nr:ribose-phosphate pyrophosphokinase [Nitrososphaerales archaeon]
MRERLVLAGPASEELGKNIASKLGSELLTYEFKQFADGESKFTIDAKLDGKSVVLVQSTYPSVDQHLMQLFFLSHQLSQEGARVTAVVPYLAYARQDKEFLPGEVVSLGVIGHLLRAAGVRRIVTVDIHSTEGLSLFSMPIYSVSAIPDLASYAKANTSSKNAVVISPDFGASKRTEAFAKLYGAKLYQLKKTRDRKTGDVKVDSPVLSVAGSEVLIVDDIITTGGTVAAAAEAVRKKGATKVYALCTHPILVGGAEEKMKRAGVDAIIGTNSVKSSYSLVDVSGPICSHINTLED